MGWFMDRFGAKPEENIKDTRDYMKVFLSNGDTLILFSSNPKQDIKEIEDKLKKSRTEVVTIYQANDDKDWWITILPGHVIGWEFTRVRK